MAVHFDISDRSVLAVCTECVWLELVTARDTAYRIALEHVWSVHPENLQAVQAIGARQRRHRRVATPSA